MTGAATSPPITDGRAPSMPATATTTEASRSTVTLSSSRCRPATPTSTSRTTSQSMSSAVSAASSATGASDVPALATTTPGTGCASLRRSTTITLAVSW